VIDDDGVRARSVRNLLVDLFEAVAVFDVERIAVGPGAGRLRGQARQGEQGDREGRGRDSALPLKRRRSPFTGRAEPRVYSRLLPARIFMADTFPEAILP